MDKTFQAFIDSGRHLILDTKVPRKMGQKTSKPMTTSDGGDPHKVFVKYSIANKPKKAELLVDIKKFIKQAEDLL